MNFVYLTRAHARTALVLAMLAALAGVPATGHQPSTPTGVHSLTPIYITDVPTPEPTALPSPSPAMTPVTAPASIAAVAASSPEATRKPKKRTQTPEPTRKPSSVASSGAKADGDATFYCDPGRSRCPAGYSGGLYAAAGPALRKGNWRGRTVVVRWHGAEIEVTLVDWCACGNGRVIDLFADAFRELSDENPWRRGVLHDVEVSW